MSTLPENEFDLEKLFLPAWAQEQPSSVKYAKYEGEAARPERRGERRGPRPPRRDGPPGGRREGDRTGGRPRDERRGPSGPAGQTGRPAGDDRGERSPRGERPFQRRGEFRERRELPPPLVEVDINLIPEEKGVDSLARQIKMTGRAYPLFDIAQMILQKPERHVAVFSVKKNVEGKPMQPLFVCALDETLWLSEDEAVAHVLKKHFGTFYQTERTATEPPKGKYTFVAQCGMSGAILGPPNHHDYQNQLRKLHAERFSRLPFDVYKARVKIVRDEEVVKKWVDDQSWKTDYICLNMPEPLRLANLEAVEKHFRETHKENIIKPVESHTMNGAAARALRSLELTRLLRSVWEDQRRFPLQLATVLSQQFAERGLQFFKVNKTVTHVSVARPHYLDMALTPVSEGVKRIVDLINATTKCTRRHLLDTLAPSPLPVAVPAPVVAPAAETASPEGQSAPTPTPPLEAAAPTPEQTAVISDLHWLVHQGHVIEFANGTLETAKKPLPKPPKPEPKLATATAKAERQMEPDPAAELGGTAPPVEAPSPATEVGRVESPTAEVTPEAGASTDVESAQVAQVQTGPAVSVNLPDTVNGMPTEPVNPTQPQP